MKENQTTTNPFAQSTRSVSELYNDGQKLHKDIQRALFLLPLFLPPSPYFVPFVNKISSIKIIDRVKQDI